MLIRDNEYQNYMQPVNFTVSPILFESQKNISKNMREIMLDWLMEVCEEFMIKRDTMYIAISFIDRYVS